MKSQILELLSKMENAEYSRLQNIVYKDVCINSMCIRILGISHMNYGTDWLVRSHKHSFYEMHYVLNGTAFTTIDKTEYKTNGGQFYLMPPGTIHSHRQDLGTYHKGFALRWEFAKASGELNTIMRNAHSRPVSDKGEIAEIMSSLLINASNGDGVLELQLKFTELLLRLAKYYPSKSDSKLIDVYGMNEAGDFRHDSEVDLAIKFIEDNYTKNIDIHEITHAVHISYSHLSRLFRQKTGHTINHYINTKRITEAEKLLKSTKKSIAQVAAESGFNSEHYFCNAFKKFTNMTPGKFRDSEEHLSDYDL